MGGSGSGRQGGKPTIGRTRSYELTVRLLRDFLKIGRSGFRMMFRSDCDEVVVVGLIEVLDSAPHIWMQHFTRCEPREPVNYRISLVSTSPYGGGLRWWFLCPHTGRRAAKLYLPLGGRQFLSREGSGLVHDTRQMSRVDLLSRRVTRIAGRLGVPDGDFFEPPEKPPRMRWSTYDGLVDEWYQARNAYWGALDRR
jgi:hypothetical protein